MTILPRLHLFSTTTHGMQKMPSREEMATHLEISDYVWSMNEHKNEEGFLEEEEQGGTTVEEEEAEGTPEEKEGTPEAEEEAQATPEEGGIPQEEGATLNLEDQTSES